MVDDTPWGIRWAEGARKDLYELFRYILHSEGPEVARKLAGQIRANVKERLSTLPLRGHPVPELAAFSQEYKETHAKGFRIVYLPIETDRLVWILLVARGRRSIHAMLRERLLELARTATRS